MYTHADFNYIGYNTIRMYDSRLTQPEYVNRPLWDRIVGIIPYYQREFDIDGVMIDMGHALPMALKAEMVNAARSLDHDFAFWDENFSITQQSREEGYNAVFGFLWVDEHHPSRMKSLLHRLSTEGFPIPFFATPENHNTPRAASRPGGVPYARWALVINSFLPAVPFIHSGYELAERYPINTGLDFTPEQISALPSERLPLFSEYAYNWLSKEEFTSFVKKVIALRAQYEHLVADPSPASFRTLEADNAHILAFARVSHHPAKRVVVVGNTDFAAEASFTLAIESQEKQIVDLITGTKWKLQDGKLCAKLAPGGCLVFEN
jgi:hypothetical protein